MQQIQYSDLIQQIKKNPINEFYTDFCKGIKFINAKDKYNCLFCNSKDNMSYNKKDNTMHCFGCDTTCDHINLVKKMKNLEFIESLKLIANYYGYEHEINNTSTTIETVEEMEEREKKFKLDQINREKQKELDEQKNILEKQKVIEKLTIQASVYRDELEKNWTKYSNRIQDIFPNQTKIFNTYKNKILGWDIKHDSLVILIYDGVNCVNIKHHKKYIWDEVTKTHDKTNRILGKWISSYNCTISPFFKDTIIKENDTYIITEGEKDAINIISIGGNATTLGGVTNSWNSHKELLRDKVVYIWFDNDKAGYINAMERYLELKNIVKDIFIVLFFHIDSTLDFKYDISDFIQDNKLNSYDDLMEKIHFSCYKLTNDLIDNISEYIDMDDDKVNKFYNIEPQKDFKLIVKEFIKTDRNGNYINIPTVKGEFDRDGINTIVETIENIDSNPLYKNYENNLLNTILIGENKFNSYEEVKNAFKKFTKVRKSLITNYTKNHISDMIIAFLKMTKKTGFTIANYKNNMVIWNGAYYEKIEQSKLVNFILNDWFYISKVDTIKHLEKNAIEIISNVKARGDNIDELKKKNKDKRIINLTNGTLILTQMGNISFKKTHHKNDGATNILNFSYNPNAKCPKWQKFLNRVLPDPLEQESLMQYIGCCLLPSHAFETFVILYGKSGANGKSVILDTISNFFGTENISFLDLQQFHSHELEALSNKFINIGSEINAKGLYNDQLSNLKKLVSPKDSLTINPKNKDPYTIEAFEKPKLIFSTNEKPKQGLDDAVFRRMLLFTFDTEIKDNEKIRDLSDRFKDELDGILNFALEKVKILIKNGTFTRSIKMNNEIELYKDEVDPMRRYIKENIKLNTNSIIPKKLLYAHYNSWINDNGFKSLNESNFSKKLKESLPKVDISRKSLTIHHDYLQGRSNVYSGVFCTDTLYPEFEYKDNLVQTASINFDKNTKAVLIN